MNIYISNLSYSVNDAQLEQLFAQFGEVTSAKVITDKFSGRSRGFGFVEMAEEEASQNAINQLNGTEFEGRTVSVSLAKPREEKPRRFAPRNNKF